MLQQRPAQNTGTTWHACTNILPSRHLSITNTSHISLLFCSSFPPNLPELLDGLLAVCAHEIQQVHDTQKLLERESQQDTGSLRAALYYMCLADLYGSLCAGLRDLRTRAHLTQSGVWDLSIQRVAGRHCAAAEVLELLHTYVTYDMCMTTYALAPLTNHAHAN
jgi:hypothetical protein